MSSISKAIISRDLDFLINEIPTQLTGVAPASIANLKFLGSFQSTDTGFMVDVSGLETEIDTEFCYNSSKHSVNPSKGAILQDEDGTKYKVADVKSEKLGILKKLYLSSQFQRSR